MIAIRPDILPSPELSKPIKGEFKTNAYVNLIERADLDGSNSVSRKELATLRQELRQQIKMMKLFSGFFGGVFDKHIEQLNKQLTMVNNMQNNFNHFAEPLIRPLDRSMDRANPGNGNDDEALVFKPFRGEITEDSIRRLAAVDGNDKTITQNDISGPILPPPPPPGPTAGWDAGFAKSVILKAANNGNGEFSDTSVTFATKEQLEARLSSATSDSEIEFIKTLLSVFDRLAVRQDDSDPNSPLGISLSRLDQINVLDEDQNTISWSELTSGGIRHIALN